MPQPERFEVVVLGSGVGGKLIAWHLAQSGHRTAVVERRWIGGACPNVACMPSKNEIPNVPGLEAAKPLTHVEALELDYLPQHLIVIGGGYSGLELAQAYRRFGSDVTILESGPQLMGREDIDVSREMRRILSDEGMRVLLEAQLLEVRGRSGDKVTLVVRTPSGEQNIDGSDILVAVGRIPNTSGIGLEDAGVELDGRGYIRVKDRLETSAPGVWALGECAGNSQFTHISEDDFRIVRDNGGRKSQHARPAGSILHVHRPPSCPCRAERRRSGTPRRHRTGREAADGLCAWGAGDRSKRGLHESSCRRERRPHPWLHDDRGHRW